MGYSNSYSHRDDFLFMYCYLNSLTIHWLKCNRQCCMVCLSRPIKIPQDGCYILLNKWLSADLKFCLIGGEHLLEGGCLTVRERVLI